MSIHKIVIVFLLCLYPTFGFTQDFEKLRVQVENVYLGKWKDEKNFVQSISGNTKIYKAVISGFDVIVLIGPKDREIAIEKIFSIGDITSMEANKRYLFERVLFPISSKYQLPIVSRDPDKGYEANKRGCTEKVFGSGITYSVDVFQEVRQQKGETILYLSDYYGKTGKCEYWADERDKTTYEDMPGHVRFELKFWKKS